MAGLFLCGLHELGPGEFPLAGAKAQSLGKLTQLGFSVPPGSVLLTTAYDAFLDHNDLRHDHERVARLMGTDSIEVESLAAQVATGFMTYPMPPDVLHAIGIGLEHLPNKRIAVRSSANVEDSESAAWAGQLQTILNVRPDDLINAVRKAWSSLFLPRAIAYARNRHLSLQRPRVAVILQETIDAAVAGVLFTVDPVTQNQNHLLLEAVFGLGEYLVQGTIRPDSYWIEKSSMQILRHRAVSQSRQLRLVDNVGTQAIPVEPLKVDEAKLTPDDVNELVHMGIMAERAWLSPLDIEWCKDESGHIYVLQARPITTIQRPTTETEKTSPRPEIAKSITRGWTLLFCEVWHAAYTREFYHQFGWGLSEVFYEGRNGVVNVYRAPSEFLTGMNRFVREHIESDPHWLDEQATDLREMVQTTTGWLETVERTPLSEYTGEQLVTILDEFMRQNTALGPRYVLMLWFPIQMETHPQRERYSQAVASAIQARIDTHRIGGLADAFARRLAAEGLIRENLPVELARVVPAEMLRESLMGIKKLNLPRLNAFNRQFLVTNDGVRHEELRTYCIRTGTSMRLEDHSLDGSSDMLYGVTAFPGKVRGPAQLLRGPEDFPSFHPGSILIASMTTPDFEVVMNNAAGIATDEGGATCHAAILARELQKPTIIGTGSATRLFSSGDLAEIDGDDGFIQKLPVGVQEESSDEIEPSPLGDDPNQETRLVLVVENELKTRSLLLEEFYYQARGASLQMTEVGSAFEAMESLKRLTRDGRSVDAAVVDLVLETDPWGGTKLVEKMIGPSLPADRIFVFSTMATSKSRIDAPTRDKIFNKLESLGVSNAEGNVFGKVEPEEVGFVHGDRGELATTTELVTKVLTRWLVSFAAGGSTCWAGGWSRMTGS